MTGLIFLSGGGSRVEEEAARRGFLAEVRSQELLYLPFALDPGGELLLGAHAWMVETLELLALDRVFKVTTVTDPIALPQKSFDGIMIGGGNSYRLLHLMKKHGFDRYIQDHLAEGKPLYGSSAGAIVLGASLAFSNSDKIYSDENGFDLLGGFSCFCHFEDSDLHRAEAFRKPTLCLSEAASVKVEGGSFLSLGTQSAVIVEGQDVTYLARGE